LDRRASSLDRRSWPLGGRRATDNLPVCPSCGLHTAGIPQHDSERQCITALRDEFGRLRREERRNALRDEECEQLRYSAKTFAALAERLSDRLKGHRPTTAQPVPRAGHLTQIGVQGDLPETDAHRRDRLTAVQVTLHRVVVELQELTGTSVSEQLSQNLDLPFQK